MKVSRLPRSLLETMDYIPATFQSSPGTVLEQLLETSVVLEEEWENLPSDLQIEIKNRSDADCLISGLAEQGLLTEYQAGQIRAGKAYELILRNYRILDRLGVGGMGVVYKAEHIRLRRQVAIKTVTLHEGESTRMLQRFYSEMRSIARLNHPNIVAALDGGEIPASDRHSPGIHYFVMEYVAGKDLEKLVHHQGPLNAGMACDYIYQAAAALAEANQHQLVHRDIKPSNILITPDGQAKLLDFGLARHFRHRLTEPGITMGTIDYIAPEQAADASTVDIRADIYALGGTLYWCLCGQPPFPPHGTITQNIVKRLTQKPPSLSAYLPRLAPELDGVVRRMMACKPDDRYPTPHAVMNALLPFLGSVSRIKSVPDSLQNVPAGPLSAPRAELASKARIFQVLVVDDEPEIRELCRSLLEGDGIHCDLAADGPQAVTMAAAKEYDLVLLDVSMEDMGGLVVCRKLRAGAPSRNLKIILISGRTSDADLANQLTAGADDYFTKPFATVSMMARVKAILRLKETQDRADLLGNHLLNANQLLEQNLQARDRDLQEAHHALILGLTKLVEFRDTETAAHLKRLPAYSRCMAEEMAKIPAFAGQVSEDFIRNLEWCVPLHDIGKAAVPDRILQKQGLLDPDERIVMQTHTTLGADTLMEVAKQHGSAITFLQMAIDIARHHHERHDGSGYPGRLSGDAIPLAARIVAIGDVYDALRSRLVYKPALPHAATLETMLQASPGQFDPVLLQAFQRCAPDFERIFLDWPD